MEENKKILRNYIIYFIVFMFICFYGVMHPKAYIINDVKWLNRTLGDFPFTTHYDPYQYTIQYFMADPDDKPNYFIVNACDTGGLGFTISNVTDGSITYQGMVQFSTSCTVDGYTGNIRKYYFKLNSWDISGYQAYITYSVRVYNLPSWNVRVRFDSYEFSDTSDYEVLKQQQEGNQSIINSNSSMTNSIINNNNQNTQDIINNQSSMTQSIIDNQSSMTQSQIDSQKVCLDKEYDLTYDNSEMKGKYLNSSGSLLDNENNAISEYIPFTKGDILITNSSNIMNSASFCLYDENKSLISCEAYLRRTSITVNLSYNGYARFSTSKGNNNITKVKLTYCTNGNQAIADQNEESEKTRKGILGKLGELISNLFSTDDADVSGLNNMAGWLPPGPLDSIINLPLNLFNSLTNVLSGTCSPVILTLPFVNQQLTLPCFDSYMSQYLTGFSTVWTFVGVTVSVFILYNYLLSLYKWVDDTLTLRENNLPGYYDDNWGGGA